MYVQKRYEKAAIGRALFALLVMACLIVGFVTDISTLKYVGIIGMSLYVLEAPLIAIIVVWYNKTFEKEIEEGITRL